jgi:hypothetical protein
VAISIAIYILAAHIPAFFSIPAVTYGYACLRSETALGDFLAGDRAARFLSLICWKRLCLVLRLWTSGQRDSMVITHPQPLGR